jgi:valyl-tRNA synthetase
MGHMLHNTIQDVLVRRARMQGKNACWVPGTDHASIATEAKVVAKLAAEGIKKNDLSREEFLHHAWEWTHKHGGIILEQLKKLGASCDWNRTAFTMDEPRSESVFKVFVDLYNKGLIYRGVRMVNWDPKAQTALSDEEVIFKEQQGKLYYLRYKIASPSPSEGGDVNPTANFRYLTAKHTNYDLLKKYSKELRRFSTEAEAILWEMLRRKNLEVRFRRQHIIGDFIVDFVCLPNKLIIEVDGGYHHEAVVAEADNIRTSILNDLGFQVIRFSNEEVIGNSDEVLNRIKNALTQTSPPSEGLGEAIIATTRPETIFGDTALCINPNNPKTAWLKGKQVIVPLINRVIPVIEDDYVDVEFGTGCLKVTPAHDVNDYMLGEKYNLPSIDIFNDNGTLNDNGAQYAGMDRFEVRKQIEKDLEAAGLLEKTEPYTNKVGFSERTDVPIEPKLSMQWFLKMEQLAKPALEAVMNDSIKLHPAKFKNTYRHWMENVKDWCISRQLWWGHRIPAYYLPQGGFVVALSKEEAYQKALSTVNYPLSIDDLRQDEDCLDTWFSSWLWPISVFDGINNPENEEIKYYYPTNDLVTAPEILFFWVARMIIAGYEYRGEMPFKNVYLTGIVRDKLGRKMSKSLGNSPDPLFFLAHYGADAVRLGMLLTSPAGNDLPYDDSLCEQGRNFNNKIWNAFRLVKGWEVADIEQPESAHMAVKWFKAQLNKTLIEIDDLFSKYRLSEALMAVYKLFWDEFSSWYLEIVKPTYQKPIDRTTYEATLSFFDALLKVLHPFMPFITEELWQALEDRKDGESIMVSKAPTSSPEGGEQDAEIIGRFEMVKEIIAGVRTVRLQKNIPQKEKLSLYINGEFNKQFDDVIVKLCNLESINSLSDGLTSHPSGGLGGASSFLVGTTEFSIPMGSLINAEEEIAKMEAEIKYYEGFIESVMKKLGNERFVTNAKPEVVENERKKKADAESKIASLKEGIQALKK